MTINLRKNTSKIIKIFILLLIILSITLINANNKGEETILTSAQGLSNKKIGWGIKRNDNHKQPELVKQIIDEGHIVGNHTPIFLMSGIEKYKN